MRQHNQMTNVNMVRKGYVILQIDPLGQNELGWDGSAAFDQHFNACGNAHSLMHFSAMLVGQSITRYVVWNAIRAIDYLVLRPDVDLDKIAAWGSSGGGSQTMTVAALDERIKVAVPTHLITDTVATMKGPHEGFAGRGGYSTLCEESHPHNLLTAGLSYTSVLSLVAPRSLIIAAGTPKDLQPLWTTQIVYDELKGIYDRIGAADRLCLATVQGYHSYHSIRQFPYWAFNREFGKAHEGIGEHHDDILPSSSDRKTRTRQPSPLDVCPNSSVVTDLGSQTVHTKLVAEMAEIRRHRPVPDTAGGWDAYRDGLLFHVRKCLALPEQFSRTGACWAAPIIRDACEIRPVVFEADAGVPVRAELCVPQAQKARQAVLYLRDHVPIEGGLLSGAEDILNLVAQGYAVLALQVRGVNDMAPLEHPARFGITLYHERRCHDGAAIGRPLFGQRLWDVMNAVDLIAEAGFGKNIAVIGDGAGALWALYAAALDGRIGTIVMRNGLASYEDVVKNPCSTWVQGDREDTVVVPGVLRFFDLPDLAALLAPNCLNLCGMVDAANRVLDLADLKVHYQATIERYRILNAAGHLRFFENSAALPELH